MEDLQVMGFIDVLRAFPKIFKLFKRLRKHLLASPPDILLTIDYPGFNLALARSLRKRGFPGKICHYICPSVWAWGKNRIPKMEDTLDALFVTFPFEEHLFNSSKLDVHYVGHPLVRSVAKQQSPPIDIDPKLRVLALFPGSREKELHRNFPLQLKVISRLLDFYPDLFLVISVSQPRFSLILDQLTKNQHFKKGSRVLFVDASQNGALMKRADLAIAKSGTINLELALHHVPTIVTYGIGPLDLLIAKNLLRICLPHYSLPNIIAGDQIYPELIGPRFTEEALFNEANHFLSDPKNLDSCREKCVKLGKLLDDKLPEGEITDVLEQWTH
jgi:lipid-A-disaccharide synthase